MKSGLRDRNNLVRDLSSTAGCRYVSMKSGLRDRNNVYPVCPMRDATGKSQ